MTARHVYVHVPFCARRCSYCDFAIAVRREVPVSRYISALAAELALRVDSRHEIDTLYLGGGTPSLLGASGVERLLDVLRGHFSAAADAEITIEANPEDIAGQALATWRRAGITRVSLGVQSFDSAVLAWMHRIHDAAMARHAARAIADAGFDSWSLDLIFALPHELSRDWSRDLDEALALDPPHISAYGLTVEPRTPLARWVERGVTSDVREEHYEREFLEAHERLSAAGLRHYEVSNYGRAGHESRHNSAYWREVPYLGFGPSAHSFDRRERRWNAREYQAWTALLAAGTDPVGGSEVLRGDQRSLEHMFLALRTSHGVSVDELPREIVEKWCGQGWAVLDQNRVVLTPAGWLRLDALVGALTVNSNPC
jgi:oxygen-independent coproporphyrinogen-3 oxidase